MNMHRGVNMRLSILQSPVNTMQLMYGVDYSVVGVCKHGSEEVAKLGLTF